MDLEFKLIIGFFSTIALVVVLLVGVKLIANKPIFNYSEGERVGVLRKISKKGLFYKTYEGELMLNAGMGTVKLDTFNFSVSSQSVADSLNANIGKEIKIHYNQYLLVPYRVGSRSYVIDGFELVE